MINYYVNKNSQPTGEHEVHQSACYYAPDEENREYLGCFSDCKSAVDLAKKIYYRNSDGCFYCCNPCHQK